MTDTKQAVVDDAILIFADIEAKIPAAQAVVLTLKDIVDRGVALSMVPAGQGTALKLKIDAIHGKLAGAQADTLDLHNTMTKIAQSPDNQVDVPAPNGGANRQTY